MAEVKRYQEAICKNKDYCMEMVSAVTNPLDVETVTAINNKNNDDRALVADLLTLVEAYATRKPLLVLGKKLGTQRGDAASIGIAVLLNRINTISTSPLREDVKYGDIIVYTAALSMHNGLIAHGPAPESLLTIFPSSVV